MSAIDFSVAAKVTANRMALQLSLAHCLCCDAKRQGRTAGTSLRRHVHVHKLVAGKSDARSKCSANVPRQRVLLMITRWRATSAES